MSLDSLGVLIFAPFAVPAIVAGFLGVFALRGTRPEERSEILYALAALSAALLFRSGRPRAAQPQILAEPQTMARAPCSSAIQESPIPSEQ
jgi:hypothetical protein